MRHLPTSTRYSLISLISILAIAVGLFAAVVNADTEDAAAAVEPRGAPCTITITTYAHGQTCLLYTSPSPRDS